MLNDVNCLTICIPTYNRSKYLERLLESIVHEIDNAGLPVKIFISDNASTDDTADVVKKYKDQFSFIFSVVNEENIGPDKNIANCFITANTKYVWIIGDDDYLAPNSLTLIVDFLRNDQHIDLMYIKAQAHRSNFNYQALKEVSYRRISSKYIMSSLVGIQYTFISSIIINKEKRFVSIDEIFNNQGTYLIQLSWVLNAVMKGERFVYMMTPAVVTEIDNSGGYRFLDVFGKNFINIVNSIIGADKRLQKQFQASGVMFILDYHYSRNAFVNEREKLIQTLSLFSSLLLVRKIFIPFLSTQVGKLVFQLGMFSMRLKKLFFRTLMKIDSF